MHLMILLYQDTVVCETLIDITTESVRFPCLQDIVYNIITTLLRRYVCKRLNFKKRALAYINYLNRIPCFIY